MADTWADNSELVGGLVITGRISANTVRPEIFFPPYDEVIKLYKSGTVTPEELSEICGFSVVSTLLEAAASVNGTLSKLDFVKKLEMSFANYSAGDELEKLGKKLKKGDKVDWSKLNTISARAQDSHTDLVPASEVTPRESKFIPSGYPPIDDHLSGLPEVGIVLCGGRPGTGKTTLALRITKSFLAYHNGKSKPEIIDTGTGVGKVIREVSTPKKVAFFSIEMLSEELRKRGDELAEFEPDELERWIICDEPYSAEQIINKAATIDNLGLVIIDFADMMIIGESNESKYTELYKVLALGSKSLRVPILLLAQFSGSYSGGIPMPEHFRWTRLAEALSWMVWTIWNPEKDPYAQDETKIIPVDGMSYLCIWKVRGGFVLHREDNPGAIAIPYENRRGWHPNKSKWFVMRMDKNEKKKWSK